MHDFSILAKALTTRAVLVLALISSSYAQGDLTLGGHTMGPDGGAAPPLSSMWSSSLNNAIAEAKALDPGAGSQIEAEVNAGTLGVGVGDLGSKALGSHDNDTIGLHQNNDDKLNGITLLHEYEHVQNARANGTVNDKTGDSNEQNPCGAMGHAANTAESMNQVCNAANDGDIPDDKKKKYCLAYAKLLAALAGQYADAVKNQCPIDPPATSAMACPGC